MKKNLTFFAIVAAICFITTACSKSSNSNPTPTPSNGLSANTFKMDDTLSSATPTTVTANVSTFMSAMFSVTLAGSTTADRVGLFLKQKPTASGTYKVHHVYPADNLAANEGFIDVNYAGCNYISYDTTQTFTVTVNGSTINVQFTNLNYSFNNWVVSGYPTARANGKFSGNLNFQ